MTKNIFKSFTKLSKIINPLGPILKLIILAVILLSAVFGLIFRPLVGNLKDSFKNETIVSIPFSKDDDSTKEKIDIISSVAHDSLKSKFLIQQAKTETNSRQSESTELVLRVSGTKKLTDEESSTFLNNLKTNLPNDGIIQSLSKINTLSCYNPVLSLEFLGWVSFALILFIILLGLYIILKFKKINRSYALTNSMGSLFLNLIVGVGLMFLFNITSLNVAITLVLLTVCFSLNSLFLMFNEIEKNMKNLNMQFKTACEAAGRNLSPFFVNSSVLIGLGVLLILFCGIIFGNFSFLVSFTIPIAAILYLDLNYFNLFNCLKFIKKIPKKSK